mmetsp:Transcript_1858/g.4760  ORF Transcript_1858/g.4760 Transcript_1858/m.4760 type:complete len:156 (-) Transcript_1858:47-514(-)
MLHGPPLRVKLLNRSAWSSMSAWGTRSASGSTTLPLHGVRLGLAVGCPGWTGAHGHAAALAAAAAAAESAATLGMAGAADALEGMQMLPTTPNPFTIGAQAAALAGGSGPPVVPDWREAPCPESPPCNCYCHCREPPEGRVGFDGQLHAMRPAGL